jgi:hypothetical protein
MYLYSGTVPSYAATQFTLFRFIWKSTCFELCYSYNQYTHKTNAPNKIQFLTVIKTPTSFGTPGNILSCSSLGAFVGGCIDRRVSVCNQPKSGAYVTMKPLKVSIIGKLTVPNASAVHWKTVVVFHTLHVST